MKNVRQTFISMRYGMINIFLFKKKKTTLNF